MITMEKIKDQLDSKAMVESLTKMLLQNFEDFAETKERYDAAVQQLEAVLGETVQEEVNAIDQQTVSNLLFSGFLGLKANLDHFLDPVARNFLDVDPETYLRENTARRLPAYCQAQEMRNRFYISLTPEQKKLHEDITAYASYLETAGPKLAHYFGYLLGNEILQRVIPGYHDDPALTADYQMMLEEYFGKRLSSGMR